MDVLMVATLLIGFGLVWLLLAWCNSQMNAEE